MHRVERSVLVPYSVEQMFALVADVQHYPKFLPWCAGTHVRHVDTDLIEATIDIGYHGVRSRFTTRNHHAFPQAIRMQLVDGPFRRLHGEWAFRQLRADACKVHLSLHYQFASGLLGRVVAPVFENIATSMVDSFARRAEALYE
jgi:ribosome-associated toxin RatA of RatAB toxin-antitoxin module